MPLSAPTPSAQPFRGIPICLYFHLEPCSMLSFTRGSLPHSHEWVCAILTHGATCKKEITY